MSDHFDLVDPLAPNPEIAPLDVCDLYAFQTPGDPSRSALILNVNPLALGSAFDPRAVYRINVDTDGDDLADLSLSVVFSSPHEGRQTATVHRATGALAREPDAVGDVIFDGVEVSAVADRVVAESDGYRFFAGVRSDPFFADVEGLLNEMRFTGTDFFAGKNVFSIAFEVPNDALSSTSGIWGRTSLRQGGTVVPVDRVGGPGVTNFLNQAPEDKKAYMEADPAGDREGFAGRYTATLEAMGYSSEEAGDIVGRMLPDVLRFDPGQADGYPNGRRLTDDVIDLSIALVTHGGILEDGVGPHQDYLSEFPFLGPPHPVA